MPFPGAQLRHDIGIGHKFQAQVVVAPLHLVAGRGTGPVIRHRRCHEDRRGRVELRQHRRAHLLGRDHGHRLHAFGGSQRRRAAHQRHLGAAPDGRPGQSVTHLPRRSVGDETDRVQRLPARPGGDDDLLARQILGPEQPADFLDDGRRFRKTALALVAAGQIAGGRLHDVVAGAPQLRQVRLHHGVGQHVHVHGRNHQQRRLCGQRHGGEQVIGNARGQFGDDVGRGRGDHQQVGGVREIDVPDFGFLSQAEEIGGYR